MSKTNNLTVVLLSWKRPANIPIILEILYSAKSVNEIILWNNNPELSLNYKHPKLVVINANKNLGTTARYSVALLAKNDNIMIQDDDLCYKPEQIEKIFSEYLKDKSRIYGPFGRNLYNGKYRMKNVWGEADIIIGRTLLFEKNLLINFFKFAEPWKNLLHEDDILFSLSQAKKHFALKLGLITELSNEEALYKKPMHLEKRQKMVDYCLKFVPGLKTSIQSKNPGLFSKLFKQ